jgi:hypothetical protein
VTSVRSTTSFFVAPVLRAGFILTKFIKTRWNRQLAIDPPTIRRNYPLAAHFSRDGDHKADEQDCEEVEMKAGRHESGQQTGEIESVGSDLALRPFVTGAIPCSSICSLSDFPVVTSLTFESLAVAVSIGAVSSCS